MSILIIGTYYIYIMYTYYGKIHDLIRLSGDIFFSRYPRGPGPKYLIYIYYIYIYIYIYSYSDDRVLNLIFKIM